MKKPDDAKLNISYYEDKVRVTLISETCNTTIIVPMKDVFLHGLIPEPRIQMRLYKYYRDSTGKDIQIIHSVGMEGKNLYLGIGVADRQLKWYDLEGKCAEGSFLVCESKV
jgi:hypothetical protein